MKRIAALILLASLTAKAMAFEPFVISDIRIDGLSRISAGTVYSYLPINKGQRLTVAEAQQAIRTLYQTRFFSDVQLDREGNILVVKVVERPSIARLSIRGNKDIKTDDLKKGLREIGLAEGDTFDRLALDRVQQELISQYYNRGKYNVTITPHVTQLDRNRVAVDIEIHEGTVAKIKEINIIGNKAFTDKDIRKDFESDTSNWMSWYSKDDQYSREKLSGDLNKLQSFYMDRGYADFGLDSTQVTISPDRRSMYIDASIKEGSIYHISNIHLLGDLVLPDKQLRQLISLKKNNLFNREAIETSAETIKSALANIGYAFAEVTPLPKLDKQHHTVDLTFYIKPGQRVYVRRIVFQGNTRTEDTVLRREMRQLEGGWYSQAAIDRSKIRLQRLGFFKTVDINKTPVPGTLDEVDLIVKVEEQSAGSLQLGIGYSQYSGVLFSASVAQNNFLGTGDQFSINAQKSRYYSSTTASYYNPYLTDNGIGIGYDLSYSKADYGDVDLANYNTNTKAFSTYLNIPLTDFDSLTAGMGLESSRINTYPDYTPQLMVDYQKALGKNTIRSWTGKLGWSHDTRNSYWAPTRGGVLSASLNVALPGSTVQYYKLKLEADHYWPVGKGFVLYLDGQVGYGGIYGNQTYKNTAGMYQAGQKIDYPFWENYFSGGVTDVRGFQGSTLGPRACVGPNAIQHKDGSCENSNYNWAQPIGGAFKVLGTAQLFLPLPFLKDIDTARVSWFVDTGSAYKNIHTFSAKQLRASTGLSLQWQSPIGPLVINLAFPFRSQPGDSHYKERVQFTFGSQF